MAKAFLAASSLFVAIGLVLPLVLILLVPTAESSLLDSYDLVGEDKTADAKNFAAPGADASGVISATRTDIVSLEMAPDGESLQFKLNIGALPAGTGGYMYAVHFKAAAKPYYTCWTISWVGGQTTAAENTLGCSRFAGETQVGPATVAAGVHAGSAKEKNFVRWEVPLSALPGTGPGVPITDIYADTWFRGANPTGPGCPNTSQSACTWNQADRGPDSGTWTYSTAPKGPELNLTLMAANETVEAGPGSAAEFNLTLSAVGSGMVDVGFNATALPDGWTPEFVPANASATGGNNTTVFLRVTIPADAKNQTTAFMVEAAAEGNLTATVNLTIVVSHGFMAGGATSTPGKTGNTTDAPGSKAADEEAGVPAPSLVLAMTLLFAVAAWRRRNR